MKTGVRNVLILGLLVGILGGCSENKLSIQNEAQYPITFTFRGKDYTLSSQGSKTLEGVPNGEYLYGTLAQIPQVDWIKSVSFEGDQEGTLRFLHDETEYLILYGSHIKDSVYTVSIQKSTNDPASSQSPTAP